MKKITCFIFFNLLSLGIQAQNQGITNWWYLGYGSFLGAPFGHTKIDFSTGNPLIFPDSLEMDISRTSANISDSLGNLLFYINGYYIADASNDTMMNGNGISPTGFQITNPYGLSVPQACLILPYPDSSHLYYLFHSTVDNAPFYNTPYYLYVSVIDMNLNGGLGAVVSKNVVLLQDTLNPGKLTACKHANGRDWWLICQKVNTNTYHKFLITPSSILGPYSQSIGDSLSWSAGTACFSPDGTKFAMFHAEFLSFGGLDIFDFDRCTGVLSNDIHVIIHQSTGYGGGVAFSGNSRFLYVANIEEVYQLDMASANIPTSLQTVAVWDSLYSPNPPFATLFDIMQLAPDGKIYISTGNGTFYLHVINSADSLGLACDLVQHPIQFQSYYASGIPNHPNYFLGCDTTSICSCLTTGIPDADIFSRVKSFPNPTTGQFTLQFNAQPESGELEIYDVLGNLILKDYLSPWSQVKKVDISIQKNGIYVCQLKWKNVYTISKVLKD